MSSDWVSQIEDDTRISDLAIPGTHDSAAWTHYSGVMGSPGTWAQRKSITEQLSLGVRVLDLRVGYASTSYTLGITSFIGMFHGPVYVDSTLDSVLTDISSFLKDHDKEFVILIFQQQGKSGQRDVDGDVGKMLGAKFDSKLHKFDAKRQDWPKVSELRGKVLAMGRLRNHVAGFCDVRSWLTDGDNTDGKFITAADNLKIYLQDRYKGLSTDEGYVSMEQDNKEKFAKVKAAADTRILESPYKVLRINHMSYSNLRYQPWKSGEAMNKLLRDSKLKIQGALMMDDADKDTVDFILKGNADYCKK